MFSLPSGILPKVELLDQMVVLFVIFWGFSILFSTVAAPIYSLTNSGTRVHFSPHPCQHLLSLLFLIITILTGMGCYLIVVLICISLMTSDVEHLFSCDRLYIFFGKMFIQGLCSFLSWIIFCFILFFTIGLYEFSIFFDINPLSDIWFANICLVP